MDGRDWVNGYPKTAPPVHAPAHPHLPRTPGVLQEILAERGRQVVRYGDNSDLEDGTGPRVQWAFPLLYARADRIEMAFRVGYERYEERNGKPTWMHLVREEVAEAFKESDPVRLREELLQVAALCVSWVEKLDERAHIRSIVHDEIEKVDREARRG